MKYYVIAGEASGDMHGANLVRELMKTDPDADLRYWGGDQMQEVIGHTPVKHVRDLAFMGFVEVVANLGTILGNFKLCEKDLDAFAPDVLILIDYPGFNLRMAKYAHRKGMQVIYYISPQIWAWKESRVHKIKKYVDQMLCILPFEKDFYAKWDYEVEYVGHPLLDVVEKYRERIKAPDSEKAPVALIPGSRKQEIAKMLPVMLKVTKKFPNETFEITAAPAIDEAFYQQFELPGNVTLVYGKTHEVMFRAKAALVTSGTATLETALFQTPEVVCYKGNYISYLLARQLIKVKFISLVNLVMDREVVKELIQGDFTPDSCTRELAQLLHQDHRQQLRQDYEELRERLGGQGASERAAKAIFRFTQPKV